MSKTITSLRNQRVKDAIKLRDRRGRQRQRRIVIDGTRELMCAVESQVDLTELFVCRELCDGNSADEFLKRVAQTGTDVIQVSPDVFAKLAFGQRAAGVLGVARTPQRTLADLKLTELPLLVVLEEVEKPGNVGAVVRSADGAGATAVVVADGNTDLYNPNTIRASLGTIFTLPVVAASTAETIAWLGRHQLHVFTAQVDGEADYTEADFTRSAAMVLGSEAAGLSTAWHAAEVTSIRLPMCGRADSLNVSAAAAVLLYEAHRQRTTHD